MQMKKYVFIMAAAMTMTAVLTGCGTKQISGDWIFTEAEINGTKVEIPSDTYASFSADITGKNEYAVYGKAGVNRYNGTAKTEGGTFSAQVGAMTMMGADTEHSLFERNFIEILSGAEKAAVSKENTLVLTGGKKDGGSFKAVFSRVTLNSTSWTTRLLNTGNAVVTAAGENPPTITIGDGKAKGFSGVNSWSCTMQLSEKDRTISFENIASTKMAGPKELMTQEMTFFKLLENVTSYRISGPELTLLDGDITLVVLYLAD